MTIAMVVTTVNAHMVMATPVPYGSPNNSPLAADGSDFPCKTTSNAGATVNQIAIGASQLLDFTGSAVHGGGSCQISLTKDMPAKKTSTWQVIHSIEGGCPAKNVGGNLADGQNDGSVYSFTIPNGIAPGGYTLAWTWFNKIGNREMYMNCASVQVTGGSKKRAAQHPRDFNANDTFAIPELSERDTSFPNMFVANIPTTNCETADSTDLQFPNPGSSVEKDGSGQLTPPKGPQCSAGPAAAGGAGGGSASSGGSSGASSAGSGAGSGAAASSPAASDASGPSSAGSAGAGSSPAAGAAPSGAAAAVVSAAAAPPASAASSPAAGAAPSGTAAAVVSAAAAPSASAASAPYANASSGGAASAAAAAPSGGASTAASPPGGAAPATGSGNGVCTQAGASVCSPDGKQIGTCTSDLTVTFQPVADGTKCSGGMMVMAGSKMVKGRSANALRWAF